MESITVLSLLKKYAEWVKNGKIQFLEKNSNEQITILLLTQSLILDFEEATKKDGDISGNLDWYKTHQTGKKLWHELASYSLKNIDPDSKGNSKLFSFLDAATEFEDILYGLEDYYRDHTLHSLWVYLIGEFILRDHLTDIYQKLNWYLYNDIERDKSDYSERLVRESRQLEKEYLKEVEIHKDAIWCLIALCHDLGYSLSKLNKLNEKARKVLNFFDIPNFQQIGFSIDIEKQYLVTQFLELMAIDVRIVPSSDKKEVLVKSYRDDATYWRLCRALEQREHGILSAYLIYKILGFFADTALRGPSEEWGLESVEVKENIIRGVILFSIAQHQFDFAFLNQIGGLGEILVLADEIEEFSRYGRQTVSRKYHDTTADVNIEFNPIKPKQGKEVEISITYKLKEHVEHGRWFIHKSEQLCKFYSLDQQKENEKYCTIKSMKINTLKDNEKFMFQIFNDSSKNSGFLPDTKIEGKPYSQGAYKLTCIDDKIYHITEDGTKISLEEWFKQHKADHS